MPDERRGRGPAFAFSREFPHSFSESESEREEMRQALSVSTGSGRWAPVVVEEDKTRPVGGRWHVMVVGPGDTRPMALSRCGCSLMVHVQGVGKQHEDQASRWSGMS